LPFGAWAKVAIITIIASHAIIAHSLIPSETKL